MKMKKHKNGMDKIKVKMMKGGGSDLVMSNKVLD